MGKTNFSFFFIQFFRICESIVNFILSDISIVGPECTSKCHGPKYRTSSSFINSNLNFLPPEFIMLPIQCISYKGCVIYKIRRFVLWLYNFIIKFWTIFDRVLNEHSFILFYFNHIFLSIISIYSLHIKLILIFRYSKYLFLFIHFKII